MARQTKAQKRVALAKDVLAQLKAKKIVAGYGYFSPGGEYAGEKEPCYVCALGAMMVACCGAPDRSQSRPQVIACLVPLFSKTELALIEAAFEGSLQVGVPRGVPGELIDKCETKYLGTDRDERLPKIMRNIIRNGGEFRV